MLEVFSFFLRIEVFRIINIAEQITKLEFIQIITQAKNWNKHHGSDTRVRYVTYKGGQIWNSAEEKNLQIKSL